MALAGSKMHNPNFRLRILLIFLGGIIAFTSILYWRTELLASQEYIEFPNRNNITATTKSSKLKNDDKPSNSQPPTNRVRRDLKGYEDLY